MIAPVLAVRALVEREEAEFALRVRFGFLWHLINVLLLVEVHKCGGSYVQHVEEILEEWRESVPPTPYDMDVCFPYPKDEDPK